MRILRGKLAKEAVRFLGLAEKEARSSSCQNARNGAVIIQNSKVIGRGFNSPALGKEEFRTCLDSYPEPEKKKKFDRTCCVHAEWRAVFDALRRNPRKIRGSTLYHMCLDDNGKVKKMDQPFCTTCSRIMLDAGIRGFVEYHKKGIISYLTGEFNKLSYRFFKKDGHQK